jgi:hypothetical protein
MLDAPGPLQLATDFYVLPVVKVQANFSRRAVPGGLSILLISD